MGDITNGQIVYSSSCSADKFFCFVTKGIVHCTFIERPNSTAVYTVQMRLTSTTE